MTINTAEKSMCILSCLFGEGTLWPYLCIRFGYMVIIAFVHLCILLTCVCHILVYAHLCMATMRPVLAFKCARDCAVKAVSAPVRP